VGDYIEDNVSMTLTFEDGSIGTVSYYANGDRSLPKERLEVFQSGRVGILDDFRNLTWIADGRKRIYKSRFRQDKGHQGEWEAFVNAILTTQEPPIPYDHLFAVTRATFAAVQALRSGESVSITTL
jgi:predicted dehydrogenase